MSRKPSTAARLDALDHLRELLPIGSTVYTTVVHVSPSGLSRWIKPFIIVDGAPFDLSGLVARAGIAKRRGNHDGVYLGGAGMDMGFHLVYSIGRRLHPDGVRCTGRSTDGRKIKACRSNDHTNDHGILSRQWDRENPHRAQAEDDVYTAMRIATGTDDAEAAYALLKGIRTRIVADRQAWVAAQRTYSTSRVHDDGGYSLTQSWF